MNAFDVIRDQKVVPVIRNSTPNNIVAIVDALYKGGVKVIEITAETPKIELITEKVVDEFGERMLVGVGTVLDPETARTVIMAGAQFIVSPTLNVETIKVANRYGILSVPGAFTPTEILTAYEHGAGIVKVFPAGTLGSSYIKNIHGPLPHIPIMVTGGITLENVQDYLEKGSIAVGIGSNLVNVNALKTEKDYEYLTETAKRYVQLVKELKI